MLGILAISQLPLQAQNTLSTYTQLGFGELADRSFAGGRAMGGIGIGLRPSGQINPLNPASYSAMDSLTFLFDFGMNFQMSWSKDVNGQQKDMNGNMEYMAMQFPVFKRMAVSIGMLPYSHVGYRFNDTISESAVAQFTGSGGISEAYGGLAVDIWPKRLAIGANIGYLFGNISRQSVNFPYGNNSAIYSVYRMQAHDIKWNGGLQYTQPLGKAKSLTLGATFSPAKSLKVDSYNDTTVVTSTTTTTTDTLHESFRLPASYGLGLSYTQEHKWTAGADMLYETWGDALFPHTELRNRMRLAAGVEYIPDFMSRRYFNKVKYRAGAHYSNSYILTESKNGYKEYGASVGFGFPIRTGYSTDENRSFVNLAFEYVKVNPEAVMMVDEQYFRITLNITFNELWFYKMKMK